jgi:uncharacterized SAM-binding protein YcdF (DUF218 family)
MPTAEKRGRIVIGLTVGALGGLLAHELDLRTLLSFWHDDLLLVPLGAAAGALLWPTRARAVVAAIVCALSAVWLAVAFSPACAYLARGLVRREAPRTADAVFVLSSNMQPDGDPTPAALARLVHGLELIGEGHSEVLVLSEIRSDGDAYATLARTLLAHLKLHAEVVVIGPVVNTHDEAVDMARLAQERGWKRILLVTSPIHTRRASATFERAGLEVVSSPCAETRYDLEGLHHPSDRLTAFGHLAHERVGLWIYRWRGWI